MKLSKTIIAMLVAVVFLFSFAACGNPEVNPPDETTSPDVTDPSTTPDGNKPIKATVRFYTSVNIIEQSALMAVANAYSDLQYDLGNDINILVVNSTDPAAYTQTVRNMISSGVNEATIVQTSIVPEYYGTDKIVDLSGYLEEPNKYISGNAAWMDALEEDAYRTKVAGATATVPGLSYSSNYLTVFYNKKAVLDTLGTSNPAVGADGTLDQSRITWEWMLDALSTAKNSGKNFKNPLGLSTSEQSCEEGSFNMLSNLINMYLDQYYRDFISEVHSKSGDYSYIDAVDGDWEYDIDNGTLDAAGKYTYNINRVVDSFFNKTGYNPTSERYTEVMENLYEFLRFADQEAAYNDIFNRFNETTLVYENNNNYADLKLFYLERLDYVRTYRDAFKKTGTSGTVYPSAEQIASELGWFLMPAMDSSLSGVATNLRQYGGPNENYGIINSGQQSVNEIAVDFLRYLMSPAGQNGIFSKYKSENNSPITMRQLVKDIQIPSEIDYSSVINPIGDCNESPYLIFGKGTGMGNLHMGNTGQYVKVEVAKALSSYFRGSNSNWATSGERVFTVLKSGFPNFAEDKNFIYSDHKQVAALTNSLVNSPYKTSN